MAKHTSKKNNEVDTRLASVRGIFESLNVPSDIIDDIISDAKKSIPKTLPRHPKLTARERLISAMEKDNDNIDSKNIHDQLEFIVKYTRDCFKFHLDLPFSGLTCTDKNVDSLDSFQFAVSALEHNFNPKLIKDCDYVRIFDYAPDCSMTGKFGDRLRQAMIVPCRDLVSEMLSKIDIKKINVGTEQDIIDFKHRHGLK